MLEGYHLWNLGFVLSQLQWKKIQFPVSFQILNFLDRDYQVLYLRAMPGRSYQVSISILL
jgi:iron complex outermembrane receptor protein